MELLSINGHLPQRTPDVLTLDRPERGKIKLHPGNWVARELRRINDDSLGHVVPASAYSKRSYDKYNSLYGVDFSDITDEKMREFLLERLADSVDREKMERARETVADVFGGRKTYHTSEMFAKWKIPNRLLEVDRATSIQAKASSDQRAVKRSKTADSEIVRNYQPCSRKATPKPPGLSRSKSMFPEIGQRKTERSASVSRHSSISQSLIKPPSRYEDEVGRPQTTNSQRSQLPRDIMSSAKLRRSNSVADAERESMSKKDETSKPNVKRTVQPEMRGKVDEWIEKAPHVKREIIEKLLKVADKKTELNHAIQRTLLPDARSEVQRWLESATDEERQVALQFFRAMVTGTGLMKHTDNEKRLRVQGVIKALERGEGIRDSTKDTSDHKQFHPNEKKPSLRFLRLLSPETREKRWMKTTWHHLPEYKDDNPVNNWSSIYTRPQAPAPRQFVIHPEWG